MGLQEEFERQKQELEAGDENERKTYPELFRNRDKPVTSETITEEHERPFKAVGELLGMYGRLKYISAGSKAVEATRLRTQKFPFTGGSAPLIDVKPIKDTSNISTSNISKTIDDVLAIPSSDLRKYQSSYRKIFGSLEGFSQNIDTIRDVFNQSAEININKGENVDTWPSLSTDTQQYHTPRQEAMNKVWGTNYQRIIKANKGDQLRELLSRLEDYHISKLQEKENNPLIQWDPRRPTRGFSKSSGHSRTITIQENGKDVEIGVIWSIGDRSYRLYDATKAEATVSTRRSADRPANDDWSRFTSNARRRYIKSKNKSIIQSLERIKETNPDLYYDILGNVAVDENYYFSVEHINSLNSGVWEEITDRTDKNFARLKHKFKTKSDGSPLFFGDADNLMPASGSSYGRLKTNMENSNILKNSKYYIDIDPVTRDFFLADRNTGKPHSFRQDGKVVQINGMTPSRDWEKVLRHVMDGGDQIPEVDSLMESQPDKAIQLQTGGFGKDLPGINEQLQTQPTQGISPYQRYILPNTESDLTKASKIEDYTLRSRVENAILELDAHAAGKIKLTQKEIKKYEKLKTKFIYQNELPGFLKMFGLKNR